jgi:rhodanese-related sulfurtransferase
MTLSASVPTRTTISPAALADLLRQGCPLDLIDVRTPAEFDCVHIQGARLLPLDQLNPAALIAARTTGAPPIYLLCKSGGRATRAADALRAAGLDSPTIIEGGTDACITAGLPLVRGSSRIISLERQVRIAAGLLVLTGAILALALNPWFILLSAFVGAGLTFAGITDTCGMAMLLARMPWNTARSCTTGSCCSK